MNKKRLILCGSPRKDGRSATLAGALQQRCADLYPEDDVDIFYLSGKTITPCQACDACKETFRCIIDDDMQPLYHLLDDAHMLIIVSPVFFAGPPAQVKAVLDRLQPYFWSDIRTHPKRPAHLFVIGEGGDPHGFDPLVVSTRSALAVAGFKLTDVVSCVGLSKPELIRRANEVDFANFEIA